MSKRKTLSLLVLPDEVIYAILLMLPVKSLLQLRCVCKSLKTLISRPQFAKNHLDTGTHRRLALYYPYLDKVETYPMHSLSENPPTPTDKHTFPIKDGFFIGSLNGLVCLRDDNDCFILWNPCTSFESKISSPTPFPQITTPITPDEHAFLGYDQLNDKYKVLALAKFSLQEIKAMARLYTFGGDGDEETSNNWKAIQDIPCPLKYSIHADTFMTGNLHWFAYAHDCGQCGCDKAIISFDVENLTYCEMSLPPQLSQAPSKQLKLYVSNNSLYVNQTFHKKQSSILWLMKEYGVEESWTQLMTIPFGDFLIPRSHYCRKPDFIPLCILENGIVLLKTECCPAHLVRYDSNNGTFSHCRITRCRTRQWLGVNFTESLVSPP